MLRIYFSFKLLMFSMYYIILINSRKASVLIKFLSQCIYVFRSSYMSFLPISNTRCLCCTRDLPKYRTPPSPGQEISNLKGLQQKIETAGAKLVMRENRLYLHNVNYSGEYSYNALVKIEPTVDKVDWKTPSLFIFSVVKESLSTQAEIVLEQWPWLAFCPASKRG